MPPSLLGDDRNAWAFAPLDHPERLVVEGSVPAQRAWSTSKVLVVAAYLQVVSGGDPGRLTRGQRELIEAALTRSDAGAIRAIFEEIPGGSGPPVNAILRSIGDRVTTFPNSPLNSATWTIREQIRFLIALHEGRVVNARVSAYLIERMHPVSSQSWGLGSVGATAFKGGWVRQALETRQMGFLDGYAVVIITAGVGPVVLQSDGDSAHVGQLNFLARRLHARLTGR